VIVDENSLPRLRASIAMGCHDIRLRARCTEAGARVNDHVLMAELAVADADALIKALGLEKRAVVK
jgi:hypothetical protein